MERGDYNSQRDFPKIGTSDGWDLILHEFEDDKTSKKKNNNTLPSLKELAFYIRRGHGGYRGEEYTEQQGFSLGDHA